MQLNGTKLALYCKQRNFSGERINWESLANKLIQVYVRVSVYVCVCIR